jgi:hypothetical protein
MNKQVLFPLSDFAAEMEISAKRSCVRREGFVRAAKINRSSASQISARGGHHVYVRVFPVLPCKSQESPGCL